MLCMDRNGYLEKWWPVEDVVIGWIGFGSHQLGSLLGAIELTVLCAILCRVGYFNAQIMGVLLYKQGGLTNLPLWENVTSYLHGIKLRNILQSLSFPVLHLWEFIAQISSNPFQPNQLIFTVFRISTFLHIHYLALPPPPTLRRNIVKVLVGPHLDEEYKVTGARILGLFISSFIHSFHHNIIN